MTLLDWPTGYRRLPTDTEFRQWQDAADRYRKGVCVGLGCQNRPIRQMFACGRDACAEYLATIPDDVLETWDGPAPQPLTVLVAMTRWEWRLEMLGMAMLGGGASLIGVIIALWLVKLRLVVA